MIKIIALTTSYNRCVKTIKSLETLIAQKNIDFYNLEIYVVDDGSTDDTYSSINAKFPQINIIKGTGNLYWAGGMRYAWEMCIKNKDFNYLLVFNDDIVLYEEAVSELILSAEQIAKESNNMFAITGAFKDQDTNELSYSGVSQGSKWHPLRFKKIPPDGSVQECITLNMNLALISRTALKEIGFLSTGFKHGKADYDYGLRLRKAGGKIYIAPHYVGFCSRNTTVGKSTEKGITIKEKWKRLLSFKEQSPKERGLYYRRHAGKLWPVYWSLPYIRISMKIIFQITAGLYKKFVNDKKIF